MLRGIVSAEANVILSILATLAGGAAAFAGHAWWASSRSRGSRRLKRTKPVRIADARDGEVVRITGTARRWHKLNKAPISTRDCIAWDVRVDAHPIADGSYRTVDKQAWTEAFIVEDASGLALVRAATPVLLLEKDMKGDTGLMSNPTPEFEAYLNARNLPVRELGTNHAYTFREDILVEGDSVTVLGLATRELLQVDADDGYREPATTLVLVDPTNGNVVISDRPSLAK